MNSSGAFQHGVPAGPERIKVAGSILILANPKSVNFAFIFSSNKTFRLLKSLGYRLKAHEMNCYKWAIKKLMEADIIDEVEFNNRIPTRDMKCNVM